MSFSRQNNNTNWCVETSGFDAADLDKCSGRFMIGNGAVGLRGTLEEYSKHERVACTLAGLYDQVPGHWREPVNAPNGFSLRVWCDGQLLSPLLLSPSEHRQHLDMREALYSRTTSFTVPNGVRIRIEATRMLSAANVKLGIALHKITVDRDAELTLETGIDGDVWDINGPHLKDISGNFLPDGVLVLSAHTQENKVPVAVATALGADFLRTTIESKSISNPLGLFRRITWAAKAGEIYTFVKYIGIVWGQNAEDDAIEVARRAREMGTEQLLKEHTAEWSRRWARSDVEIDGDDISQQALRHSIYQLLLATPAHSDRMSIPARGLSGQVYKGGVFWDTEMFMLPFFDHTQPEMGRLLLRYRYHTLDGARRKAAELGWRGAFYAWESQDSGDDACTLFNVTDVFTGRPMRTFFKDKQVHISADVAYATWRHFQSTGDASFLLEGGAEVILECARFFVSLAIFNPDRGRYEIRDVVGPDEYHERVDNNAFTSALAHKVIGIALELLAWLRTKHTARGIELLTRIDFERDAARLNDLNERLFVPQPDEASGVIEQFSGYNRLEDATLAEVKSRVLKPNEYWGGGNGIAVSTRIIKQADTVLLMHLLAERYPAAIREANWNFYEPRTEHGSSLSACMYALVAASIGKVDWAYRYFLKTATIDLTGESKQYVGTLYIGGTHPAANGGAWMAAVLGFGGLVCTISGPKLNPRLPAAWRRLAFRFVWRGNWFSVEIDSVRVHVRADIANPSEVSIDLVGTHHTCAPGSSVSSELAKEDRATELIARARGVIFDLDGVIVDTARFHYEAWRRLAQELGFEFTLEHNERLKGVSRARSLEILLEIGGINAGAATRQLWLERKNRWYLESISTLNESDLLPGVQAYLQLCRSRGQRVALGSASKNAPAILERLGVAGFFDALIDGNKVAQAKPDPEVFLRAASELSLRPEECVVFEDATAGVEAARRGGMRVIGIGDAQLLRDADVVIPGLHTLIPNQ